ncbi:MULTISPECIES: uracil-DNA glycosylase [Brevibacillus]|jgi:uracil-DNA glycosylase|uniref:Uracil-DNA glycosylase n=1 Tax=Brevibacillus borstelensis AK1 TaxID=1300222 RepID=M8D818_9BACL|nr:uracil-DNA glycosylase [Brevibacillus borstelensis]EMT52414.1 uracil-DNA glycosylase [Brevibacillus borstelensis AK1]MCC0563104.1 uracil-DNA glycosylase [Brevibacillus borstelensis]MCM3558469.1 uracil-DNA glycosylase [Brevibacillus borstelensis]MCM3590433.1 uracil-DNA glycosylase [Brevibacillus borstelensis]MCM3621421.1 uracil-DNA glycosylase [Brevibacillus borstelensis]
MSILRNDWAEILADEFEKPYYIQLREFLKTEYQSQAIYPDMYDIFNALHLTPYREAKVVILGQDPYHGPGQAHGLSFSVKPGVATPPSLQNIYKELQSDLGCTIPQHGYLVNWAKQGVLLLNTVLTVRGGNPNSHKGKGWEIFTDRVIAALNDRETPLVFILWGRHAQEKASFIDTNKHFIISSPHPSPFSANRGFFGSRPFSRTNQFLRSQGMKEIDWQLPLQAELEEATAARS